MGRRDQGRRPRSTGRRRPAAQPKEPPHPHLRHSQPPETGRTPARTGKHPPPGARPAAAKCEIRQWQRPRLAQPRTTPKAWNSHKATSASRRGASDERHHQRQARGARRRTHTGSSAQIRPDRRRPSGPGAARKPRHKARTRARPLSTAHPPRTGRQRGRSEGQGEGRRNGDRDRHAPHWPGRATEAPHSQGEATPAGEGGREQGSGSRSRETHDDDSARPSPRRGPQPPANGAGSEAETDGAAPPEGGERHATQATARSDKGARGDQRPSTREKDHDTPHEGRQRGGDAPHRANRPPPSPARDTPKERKTGKKRENAFEQRPAKRPCQGGAPHWTNDLDRAFLPGILLAFSLFSGFSWGTPHSLLPQANQNEGFLPYGALRYSAGRLLRTYPHPRRWQSEAGLYSGGHSEPRIFTLAPALGMRRGSPAA
jgi:hypothetical protein